MKKIVKKTKLALRREVVKQLTKPEIAAAVGGLRSTLPSCDCKSDTACTVGEP